MLQLFGRDARTSHSATNPARRPLLRSAARLASIAVIGASIFAAPQAFASGIEQLKAFVSQVKSARGDFVQKQVKAPSKAQAASSDMAMPNITSTSSGTFLFARPGKFIWSYEKPYEQVLQADGDNLYVYDKDLNQVTVRKLGGALGASPAAILFGSNDLEKNFTLRDAGVKAGIDWLELTPKAKDTTFDHIGIGFRNGVPEAMELRDSFGQTSMLTFTNFEKNPPISADQFKFVMPKGADLFQQ